jgi:hypothetical protein
MNVSVSNQRLSVAHPNHHYFPSDPHVMFFEQNDDGNHMSLILSAGAMAMWHQKSSHIFSSGSCVKIFRGEK